MIYIIIDAKNHRIGVGRGNINGWKHSTGSVIFPSENLTAVPCHL